MTKDNLNKLVLTIITATIFGGWNWIRDIETRIAIIEDDLDETVTVIGVLHPPSPIRPRPFSPTPSPRINAGLGARHAGKTSAT